MKIDGMIIKERETQLSEHNSKSCYIHKFTEYLRTRNEQNELIEYYEKRMYRKMKFEGYRNQQMMAEKLIKKFKNKYGGAEEAVIMMEDWSKGKQMKHT